MSLIFILIRISPCRARIDRLVLTNYMEVNSKFSMLLKELRVFAMAYYSLCFSKKKKEGHGRPTAVFRSHFEQQHFLCYIGHDHTIGIK